MSGYVLRKPVPLESWALSRRARAVRHRRHGRAVLQRRPWLRPPPRHGCAGGCGAVLAAPAQPGIGAGRARGGRDQHRRFRPRRIAENAFGLRGHRRRADRRGEPRGPCRPRQGVEGAHGARARRAHGRRCRQGRACVLPGPLLAGARERGAAFRRHARQGRRLHEARRPHHLRHAGPGHAGAWQRTFRARP